MLYFKSGVAGILISVLGGLVAILVRAAIAIRQLPVSDSGSRTISFSPGYFACSPVYLVVAVSFLIGFAIAYRLMR
jgi:hypothetical protein